LGVEEIYCQIPGSDRPASGAQVAALQPSYKQVCRGMIGTPSQFGSSDDPKVV
jgi:hypothetical protein